MRNGRRIFFHKTFALLEPGEDTEADSPASKIAELFHLNSSGVEDEILTLQSYIQLMSRAHRQFWKLKLATSSYCPDYAALADTIQCKSSK